MYQECFKQITYAIDNWPVADVRTLPGVMYQIRCGKDENDLSIEYQINWFIDCTETFIHNHRHSFDTLCLEGGYLEKLWEIVDDNTDNMIYQFYRNPGNIIDIPKKIPGVLRHVNTRHHFPSNQMHVDTTQFHSISSIPDLDARIFTFLARQEHLPTLDTYILSESSTINAPSDAIRSATTDERQSMYNQLLHILKTKFH